MFKQDQPRSGVGVVNLFARPISERSAAPLKRNNISKVLLQQGPAFTGRHNSTAPFIGK